MGSVCTLSRLSCVVDQLRAPRNARTEYALKRNIAFAQFHFHERSTLCRQISDPPMAQRLCMVFGIFRMINRNTTGSSLSSSVAQRVPLRLADNSRDRGGPIPPVVCNKSAELAHTSRQPQIRRNPTAIARLLRRNKNVRLGSPHRQILVELAHSMHILTRSAAMLSTGNTRQHLLQ